MNITLNLIHIVIAVVGISFLFIFLYFLICKLGHRIKGADKFDDLYKKISEDIKYAVTPKFVELSIGVNDLVDLAIEVWKIDQRVTESTTSLTENHFKGLNNSIDRLKRYIQKYDIEIVDYTNQKFNDGWNLEILSVEKDSSIQYPIVKKTIEPTVICKGQVVRRAKIILLTNN